MTFEELYRIAASRVPAYRRFLTQRLGSVPEVVSREDFAALPLTSKKDYVKAFPLEDLCLDGTLEGKHVLCRSSGSTGKPTYWPQMPEQERYVADYLYTDLDEDLQISLRPALALVVLGLGSWISGELTTWGLRTLGIQKGHLTLATPGINLEEAAEILEEFGPRFPQTVLYSYPPFAKRLLEMASDRGVDLSVLRVSLRLAGEGYSERYRDHVNRLLGYPEGHLTSVVSGYGSTDFGSAGKETPLCVAIRRALYEGNLTEKVLGVPDLPSVCQYDPAAHLLEVVEGELVASKYQAVPLVRYRSGDRGELVPFREMMARLADAGVDPLRVLEERGCRTDRVRELPFVLVHGRIDGGVTFFAANILVGQVQGALETDPVLAGAFTGAFQLRCAETEDLSSVLEIRAELRPGATAPEDGAPRLARELARRSTEYAAVWESNGDRALPQIVPVEAGSLYSSTKVRYLDR